MAHAAMSRQRGESVCRSGTGLRRCELGVNLRAHAAVALHLAWLPGGLMFQVPFKPFYHSVPFPVPVPLLSL